MKSPKPPAAPDPVQTAAAQTASNRETAIWNAALNNINQVTPYGNLTYTKEDQGEGLPPQYTSTITLTPEQQSIYDSMTRSEQGLANLGEQQIGRITESVSSPYSYAGLGGEISPEDVATQQANAESAYMARLNPQFQRDEEALRSRLINQGIGQGSQAYQREMESFNQMKNDARSQAILAGQQYGGTAQQQALQRRNQAISEYDAQRNAPLNEYIGMTSGVQIQNPQFSSKGYEGAAGVDMAGLINQNYQNQMAQYNAAQSGRNNMLGTIAGLGGSFLTAPMKGGGSVAGNVAGRLFGL